MWFDRKRCRFYAVFHAHTFIGMVTSEDGYNWTKAAQYKITIPQICFDDGTAWHVEQMQRPFVLADDQGQPQWLFVAVKNGDRSYDVAMPLKSNSK